MVADPSYYKTEWGFWEQRYAVTVELGDRLPCATLSPNDSFITCILLKPAALGTHLAVRVHVAGKGYASATNLEFVYDTKIVDVRGTYDGIRAGPRTGGHLVTLTMDTNIPESHPYVDMSYSSVTNLNANLVYAVYFSNQVGGTRKQLVGGHGDEYDENPCKIVSMRGRSLECQTEEATHLLPGNTGSYRPRIIMWFNYQPYWILPDESGATQTIPTPNASRTPNATCFYETHHIIDNSPYSPVYTYTDGRAFSISQARPAQAIRGPQPTGGPWNVTSGDSLRFEYATGPWANLSRGQFGRILSINVTLGENVCGGVILGHSSLMCTLASAIPGHYTPNITICAECLCCAQVSQAAGPQYWVAPLITSTDVALASIWGGARIAVTGRGLEYPRSVWGVLVAGRSCVDTAFESAELITCTLPHVGAPTVGVVELVMPPLPGSTAAYSLLGHAHLETANTTVAYTLADTPAISSVTRNGYGLVLTAVYRGNDTTVRIGSNGSVCHSAMSVVGLAPQAQTLICEIAPDMPAGTHGVWLQTPAGVSANASVTIPLTIDTVPTTLMSSTYGGLSFQITGSGFATPAYANIQTLVYARRPTANDTGALQPLMVEASNLTSITVRTTQSVLGEGGGELIMRVEDVPESSLTRTVGHYQTYAADGPPGGAASVFDGDRSTTWDSGTIANAIYPTGHYVVFGQANPFHLWCYTMVVESTHYPIAWTVRASHDKSTWTVIDTVTARDTYSAGRSASYKIDTPGHYRYYGWYPTEGDTSAGAGTFRISEIELNPPGTSPAAEVVLRTRAGIAPPLSPPLQFADSATPQVSAVQPTEGSAGDTLSITGSGLAGATSVSIGHGLGSPTCAIAAVSATSISCVLGAGVASRSTVSVRTASGGSGPASSEPEFLYRLSAFAFAPEAGAVGGAQLITIHGQGFSSEPSQNAVTIGGQN
jgi:hypothetical protein